MVGPSGRFSNFPWLGDPLRLLFGVLLRPERQPQLPEIRFQGTTGRHLSEKATIQTSGPFAGQ
jgi:hypothetical protein